MDWEEYNNRRLRKLKGRLWGWVRLVSSILTFYYPACITLTYSPSHSWHSKDISSFIDRVRAYYKRKGWRCLYFWVAELQERGAVHFHIVIFVPRGHKLPKPDRRGWWKKGFTNIMAVKHFYSYFTKYLQKCESERMRFPKGLRLFGYGGLDFIERAMYRVLWLHRRVRECLLEVLGVFLVVKKRGSVLELLVGGERVIVVVYYGIPPPLLCSPEFWSLQAG